MTEQYELISEFSHLMVSLAQEGERELIEATFNRCWQAFDPIYEYEQDTFGSFWRIDEQYYEQNIENLYERYCYAMAIIADEFHMECTDDLALPDADKRSVFFVLALAASAKEIFKRRARDMGQPNTIELYYERDSAHDDFWDAHEKLQSEVIAVRKGFHRPERNFLHGFRYNEKDDLIRDSWDFLHVMRVYNRSGDLDVEKFLGDTKRIYLPTIIKSFVVRPKPVPKWWKFWKK